MSRRPKTIDIYPSGGDADRAAADSYRHCVLALARMAPVPPTRTWLAKALGTSRNRLQRILDVLGIEKEHAEILKAHRERARGILPHNGSASKKR